MARIKILDLEVQFSLNFNEELEMALKRLHSLYDNTFRLRTGTAMKILDINCELHLLVLVFYFIYK